MNNYLNEHGVNFLKKLYFLYKLYYTPSRSELIKLYLLYGQSFFEINELWGANVYGSNSLVANGVLVREYKIETGRERVRFTDKFQKFFIDEWDECRPTRIKN